MGSHTEGESKKSGFATASLVLSIIAIVCSWIPLVNNIAFILGILAIIFSIVSLAKKASKGMAIAGIIIAIIACVIVYQSQTALGEAIDDVSSELDKSLGNSTEEVLANEFDVTYGEYEVEKDTYSSTGKLVVTVKNKTSETKSGDIQLEAVDGEGNRITNDYVYINSLGAGQSQKFEVFNTFLTDDINEMKSATFKIVEASSY